MLPCQTSTLTAAALLPLMAEQFSGLAATAPTPAWLLEARQPARPVITMNVGTARSTRQAGDIRHDVGARKLRQTT